MLFMLSPITAQPEASDPPLMIALSREDHSIEFNDLYQYVGGEWLPVTTGGFKSSFSLSPSGNTVAYLSVPDFLSNAVAQGEPLDYLLAFVWNLALLDLRSGESQEIAGQPDSVLFANGQIEGGIKRSAPVWSPDGQAIAWTEQDAPAHNSARLVVYDLQTGETRTLEDTLPGIWMSSDGMPSILSWGNAGIAVFGNDPTFNSESMFRIYDPATGSRQTIRISEEGYGGFFQLDNPAMEDDLLVVVPAINHPWNPSAVYWVKDGSGEWLTFNPDGRVWLKADTVTGSVYFISNQLEFVSAAHPEDSLRLVRDVNLDQDAPKWQFLSPDGTPLDLLNADSLGGFAFSPSGQSLAYYAVNTRQVMLFQEGITTPLTIPDDMRAVQLLWGPTRVQFGADATAAINPVLCDKSGCG